MVIVCHLEQILYISLEQIYVNGLLQTSLRRVMQHFVITNLKCLLRIVPEVQIPSKRFLPDLAVVESNRGLTRDNRAIDSLVM